MALLQSALIKVLEFFYVLTGSYEISLILLSAFVSLVLAPFYHLTGILEKKERTIKLRLAMYKPSTHRNLNELYEQFGYWPFYSIRSLASLFIQIPILIAAYNALSDYAPLKGTWLGSPDAFFAGLNLLPFAMTLINLCAVFISSEPSSKERKQGIFIAMVFFFLLYASPAALLIYWTFNQLFTFARYLKVYPLPKIKSLNFNFGFAWQLLLALIIHYVLTTFVGGKQSIYTYAVLILFAVLIIYKFAAKAKIPFSIPSLQTLALNISVMAFPAILIYKSNEIYFDGIDLTIYAVAMLLVSVLASFIFSPKFSVSFILSLMFLPMIREITHYTSDLRISFFVLFIAVLIFASSIIKQKGAIMAFSAIASLYLLVFAGNVKLGSKDLAEKVKIPEELATLELKDSASIYLFMHDAFPRKDYAEYFSLPNYDDLMRVFEQNDFKIYDIYTMADNTIGTMSSVFDFNTDSLPKINDITTTGQHNHVKSLKDAGITGFSDGATSDFFREKMAGNNITNLLLQNNGYRTGNYNPYDRYIAGGDNFYDFVAQDKAFAEHLLEPKNLIFKNILKGTLNSGMVSSTRQFLTELAEFAGDNSEKNKIFAYGMGCPGHSSLGGVGTTEREVQKFLPLYNKCLAAMKDEIETLKQNPNAIVIFMSDHGVFLMDDGYKFPKNYDLGKTDYMKFRDIFGAFMAVRWPNREKAEKYDSAFNVSQDLFPIIFAYLFESEVPLEYGIKNTEIRIGPHKFDKGIFYQNFYSKGSVQ
ncbi:MAG: YidC/Oxa1 family membrane protein insertase [Fibromonadales bacterium]|nr:YidC/Oxa1 family membrane protein insertase [Fibromonadales bacterium]